MSHTPHDERDRASQPDQQASGATVSAWLRALAKRAEADAAFAAQMLDAARESGLTSALPPGAAPPAPSTTNASAPARGARGRKSAQAASSAPTPALDPFAVYRAQGVEGLRAALSALELPALRVIVRERRLDPARISARWTARERVISLIVDQVKARANHGHAFERV